MMHRDDLHILQVSASDVGGGAERVAVDLHRAYRSRGLDAHLALGALRANTSGAIEIPGAASGTPLSFTGRMRRRLARVLADPGSVVDRVRGLEDFNFAGTRGLLSLTPEPPDILHLHNLHGGYFDLRELPRLTAAVPTVLTLHDTWLTAGHCAYTLGCERWRAGCGECPDIARPMAIPRDSSAANWRRKRDIYQHSRVFVAGPSRWVLAKAATSILHDAIVSEYLIPNGINTTVFRPGDRARARRELGLDPTAFIVMFTAGGVHPSPFKDTASVTAAIPGIVAGLPERRVLLVALGAGAQSTDPHVIGLPFTADPSIVARYAQASDIYAHMALAETFGLAIAEAQACGLPVVASAVGGIPEVIADGETGVLVSPQNPTALADAVVSLAGDSDRRQAMGDAAAARALAVFSLDTMVDAHLAMYDAVLAHVAGDA